MRPTYLQSVANTVVPGNANRTLAAARSRHLALQPFATAEDLDGFLSDTGSEDYSTRNAVLLALLAEYQGAEGRVAQVWSFFLIRAFLPRFHGLSQTLRNSSIRIDGRPRGWLTRDDRESVIIRSFLEEAKAIRLSIDPAFIVQTLVKNTMGRAFKYVREETAYRNTSTIAEEEDIEKEMGERGVGNTGPGHFDDQLAETAPQQREALFKGVGDRIAHDRQAVAKTVLAGKDAREAVREEYPDASEAERRRLENRLRVLVHRALPSIRRAMRLQFAPDAIHARSNPAP